MENATGTSTTAEDRQQQQQKEVVLYHYQKRNMSKVFCEQHVPDNLRPYCDDCTKDHWIIDQREDDDDNIISVDVLSCFQCHPLEGPMCEWRVLELLGFETKFVESAKKWGEEEWARLTKQSTERVESAKRKRDEGFRALEYIPPSETPKSYDPTKMSIDELIDKQADIEVHRAKCIDEQDKKRVKGLRIRDFRVITNKDAKKLDMGVSQKMIIELEDGTLIFPSMDGLQLLFSTPTPAVSASSVN